MDKELERILFSEEEVADKGNSTFTTQLTSENVDMRFTFGPDNSLTKLEVKKVGDDNSKYTSVNCEYLGKEVKMKDLNDFHNLAVKLYNLYNSKWFADKDTNEPEEIVIEDNEEEVDFSKLFDDEPNENETEPESEEVDFSKLFDDEPDENEAEPESEEVDFSKLFDDNETEEVTEAESEEVDFSKLFDDEPDENEAEPESEEVDFSNLLFDDSETEEVTETESEEVDFSKLFDDEPDENEAEPESEEVDFSNLLFDDETEFPMINEEQLFTDNEEEPANNDNDEITFCGEDDLNDKVNSLGKIMRKKFSKSERLFAAPIVAALGKAALHGLAAYAGNKLADKDSNKYFSTLDNNPELLDTLTKVCTTNINTNDKDAIIEYCKNRNIRIDTTSPYNRQLPLIAQLEAPIHHQNYLVFTNDTILLVHMIDGSQIEEVVGFKFNEVSIYEYESASYTGEFFDDTEKDFIIRYDDGTNKKVVIYKATDKSKAEAKFKVDYPKAKIIKTELFDDKDNKAPTTTVTINTAPGADNGKVVEEHKDNNEYKVPEKLEPERANDDAYKGSEDAAMVKTNEDAYKEPERTVLPRNTKVVDETEQYKTPAEQVKEINSKESDDETLLDHLRKEQMNKNKINK